LEAPHRQPCISRRSVALHDLDTPPLALHVREIPLDGLCRVSPRRRRLAQHGIRLRIAQPHEILLTQWPARIAIVSGEEKPQPLRRDKWRGPQYAGELLA